MIGIEGFDLKLGLEMIRIWDLELFYLGYLGLSALDFRKRMSVCSGRLSMWEKHRCRRHESKSEELEGYL